MTVFDLPSTEELLRRGLSEDLGRGDVTTQLTVLPTVRARGRVVAKHTGIVAGLPVVRKVFDLLGGAEVELKVAEGAPVVAGTVLAEVTGLASTLLSGERLMLNLLQHLSGIATLTHLYVEAIAGTAARIVDTRKTLPGLRLLEKYAVRTGGGYNHRLGLDDAVLIKDNHIVACGGITLAVERARRGAPHTMKIEVECANANEVDEALAARADIVMLDNMTVEDMRQAVKRIAGRALVEASGGVNLATVRAVAESGVDLISVGALTHSAPALDMSMKIVLEA